MAKIAQRSVRKHIRDNCFEDVLIEMKTFGIKVEKRVFTELFHRSNTFTSMGDILVKTINRQIQR